MSREGYFVIDCSLYSSSIAQVVLAFNQIGWTFSDDKTEYLPLHDNDSFNWQVQPLSVNEVLSIITKKQECGELCGVMLYHQKSDVGIELLARNTSEITINIDINRKKLNNDFTDISWYIENIMIDLEKIGCAIQAVKYNEVIG